MRRDVERGFGILEEMQDAYKRVEEMVSEQVNELYEDEQCGTDFANVNQYMQEIEEIAQKELNKINTLLKEYQEFLNSKK